MIYCHEFVIIQSALKLIEKKVGEDKFEHLDGQLVADHLHILTTAIGEVGQGLDVDNDPEDQTFLEQKLHNLIFLKLLLTHYKAENDSCLDHDLPNPKPSGLDSMEAFPKPKLYAGQIILCGLLPPISKALYFKLVLAHRWQGHLHELLHNVEEDYAISVLKDIYDQIHNGDKEWIGFLVDFIISQIVTVPGAVRTFCSTKNMTEMADLLRKVILMLSQNQEGKCHKATSICAVLFLTVICGTNFDEDKLLTWFRSSIKGSTEDASPFSMIQSYFLDFGRTDDIGDHRMSLDLNLHMLSITKSKLLLTDLLGWCISSFKHNKDGWRLFINSVGDQSEIKQFKILCSGVVSTVEKSTMRQPQVLNIEISLKNVTSSFAKLIRKTLHNFESHEGISSYEKKDVLVQILEAVSVPRTVGEVTDDSSILDIASWEKSSLQSSVWRIYNRQPGFQDGILTILQCQRTEVWEIEQVLGCMECSKDLLKGDDSMNSLFDVTVWAYREKITWAQRIKQLVLDVFDTLMVSDRSGHMAYVYVKYRYWPDQQSDMDQRVNTVLNRLTNQQDTQVHQEVHHLALQDGETFISRAIERSCTSKEQAEIITNIFLRLPDVCRAKIGPKDDDSQRLLNTCVARFLTENKLEPKEEKHFLYFISKILQARTTEGDVLSLLLPSDLLLQLVFPYVGLSHLYGKHNGMTLSFALELGAVALESVVDQHHINSSNSVILLMMQKMFSIDYILTFVSHLGELLHKCLILWRETEEDFSYIGLKEKTVRIVEILRKVTTDLNFEIRTCHWLSQHLLACDWTVQIFMNQLLTTGEEYKMVCKNLLLKILAENDRLSVLCNIVRFAAVNDFTSAMITRSENLPTNIKYEELQLCLIQLLPNMTSKEWTRVVDLICVLLEKGHLLATPTMSSSHLPLVNLENLNLPLSLSLVLHDTVSMLQMSGVDPFLPAVNHCLRMYVNIIKNKIISQCEEIASECRVLLYLEVYLHVVRSTSWIPAEIQDVTYVLLLDLISNTDELLKNIKGDVRYLLGQNLTQMVDITAGFIQDNHTQSMILKITEAYGVK